MPVGSGAARRYQVSRHHPAVRTVAQLLGGQTMLLEGLLAIIERSVPVERIWLDVSEAEGASTPSLTAQEMASLAGQLAALVAASDSDRPPAERVDELLRHLPGDTAELRHVILQQVESAA